MELSRYHQTNFGDLGPRNDITAISFVIYCEYQFIV